MESQNKRKPNLRYLLGSGPDLEFNLEALRERAAETRSIVEELITRIPGAEEPRYCDERLIGFVFAGDRVNGDWASAGVDRTGRPVFRPDQRSRQGRAMHEQIRGLQVPGRWSQLQLFGLEHWVVETGGRLYRAQCREIEDKLVVRVPETREYRFGDHPWLVAITAADFHNMTARARREQGQAVTPA